MLALAPRSAHELARGREVVLVSGTNGKTTTSAYLSAGLRTSVSVANNQDGANTPAGLVQALAGAGPQCVVLETDEGWLPWAVAQTDARTAVLLNLSRDQLHRHHEVAALASTWQQALRHVDHVVANADDPDVVFAALAAHRQTWVGLDVGWTQDSLVCPQCGDECHRSSGDWWCGCGLRRPRPDWWLEEDVLVSDSDRISLSLGLPGRANRGNAAVAVVAAAGLGVDPHVAASALSRILSIAGRYDSFAHAGRRARLMLAKNPASWVEALEMVSSDTTPLVLAFNSEGVDGRDPSWLYDVPFAVLGQRQVVVTGKRSTDMLVRLEMDGFDDVQQAWDVRAALELLPADEVHVIANYTAFQDCRRAFGHAR